VEAEGLTVCKSEDPPCLSPCPGTAVRVSLGGAFLDHGARRRVILDNVPCGSYYGREAERGELYPRSAYLWKEAQTRTIGADVIANRRVCVGGCDGAKGVVSCEICGNKEDLEVHHIVNDNL